MSAIDGRPDIGNTTTAGSGSLYDSIMGPKGTTKVASTTTTDGDVGPPGGNTVNPLTSPDSGGTTKIAQNDTGPRTGPFVEPSSPGSGDIVSPNGYTLPRSDGGTKVGSAVTFDPNNPGVDLTVRDPGSNRNGVSIFNWVPDYEYRTDAGKQWYQAFLQRKDLPIQLNANGKYHFEYGDDLMQVAIRNLRSHSQEVSTPAIESQIDQIIELNKAQYPQLTYSNPKWHHKGEYVPRDAELILPGSNQLPSDPVVRQDAPPVIPRRNAPIIQQDDPGYPVYRDDPRPYRQGQQVFRSGGTTYDIDAPTVNIFNGGGRDYRQYGPNQGAWQQDQGWPPDYQDWGRRNAPIIIQDDRMPMVMNNSLYSRRFVQPNVMPMLDPRILYMLRMSQMGRFNNGSFNPNWQYQQQWIPNTGPVSWYQGLNQVGPNQWSNGGNTWIDPDQYQWSGNGQWGNQWGGNQWAPNGAQWYRPSGPRVGVRIRF